VDSKTKTEGSFTVLKPNSLQLLGKYLSQVTAKYLHLKQSGLILFDANVLLSEKSGLSLFVDIVFSFIRELFLLIILK
jgi:hypothetical protein